MRKIVALLLVCCLLMSFSISGCSTDEDVGENTAKDREDWLGPDLSVFDYFNEELELDEDRKSDFGSQKTDLTADSPSFAHQNVSLEVAPLFLDDRTAKAEIKKMAVPAPEGISVQAYDFSLDIAADYPGLYTINIPYESGDSAVGAGYYNASTRMWEPVVFEVDEANNQIIILTDHLSTYASFTITGEGTRYARIASGLFEANDLLKKLGGLHSGIIQEMVNNNMSPGLQAAELGMSVINDWLTASGAILEFEGLAYSSEFLSNLSDIMGHVGLSLALTQLAYDYTRGDQQAMAVNSFNTAQGLAIGKWGTKALKVSMIGVTAIDYSLSKLAEQVIGGREDVWQKAYDLYYRENNVRTGQDWFHKLKELHDAAESPAQFERLLDTELNRYTFLFWREDESLIGEYQSRAMGHALTGGGGLNESLKTRIGDTYKSNLLRYSLEPVFRRLEEEVRYQQFVEYQQELSRLRNEFNRVVTLEVQEVAGEGKELQYPDYIVRMETLSGSADARQWTGRLNKDGFLRATFTVLGHLAAGAPDEIRIYKNQDDLEKGNAEYTTKFQVEVPDTRVTIGETEDIDLTGTWDGFFVVTESDLLDLMPPDSDQGDTESSEQLLVKMAEDFAKKFEGCEVEMLLLFQEMIKELIGKDIPTTISFEMTEQEEHYNGKITIHFSKVFPDDQEDSTNNFSAVFRDGKLEFSVQEEDTVTHFTGSAVDNDNLTGNFYTPADVAGVGNFFAGNWRATRVED